MMPEGLFLVALLGAASAHHYSHGHATSSQSIIRHDNRHGYIHDQPITVHRAPISYHQPAIAVHAAPVIQHMPALRHVAPIYYHGVPVQAHGHEEHYPHQTYEFDYSVADTHTGDIKSQHEASASDHVIGSFFVPELF